MAPVPGYGDVSVRGAASAHLSAVQRGKGPGGHLSPEGEGQESPSGQLECTGYARAFGRAGEGTW